MYVFFMDGIELPVTPSKLSTKIKNNNKTINLINEGDINILKVAGLTEISFTATIPQVKYPFANLSNNAKYYLELFENLKKSKKPFQFVVIRLRGKEMLFNSDITVSLEDYTITEDAKNGFDVDVSISLKQYRSYGTKTFYVKDDKATVINARDATTAPKGNHTVVSGDTLWAISKKYYNDGSKYDSIYQANKTLIDAANLGQGVSKYTIHEGQVLTIP